MIKLSAFADEASSSLCGQIAALKRNGIPYVELRGINGSNVSRITEAEAKEYKKQLDEGGIGVFSIGSPIGKIKITDNLDEHIELLRHICRIAQIFGTDKIRMFSFYEAYESEELVFNTLRRMVATAAEYGVCLYHENEKDIYGDTAERVLRLMDNVEGLRFVYDPANFIATGELPEITLEPLIGRTDYFHIKDMIAVSGEIVPAGFGDGDIPRMISLLAERDAVMTVEPHLMVFDGYSQSDAAEMKNKFVFKSNDEAFDAAVAAIRKLILDFGYVEEKGEFVK